MQYLQLLQGGYLGLPQLLVSRIQQGEGREDVSVVVP